MKPPSSSFDTYADAYDRALAEGISVSGEGKTFFAEGRIDWLRRRLAQLSLTPASVLDFGCGTGTSVPYLKGLTGVRSVLGVDISARSLEVARQTVGSEGVTFQTLDQFAPDGTTDLAFCNGVFHHIPLDQRAGAVQQVFRSLRPGGLFSFWENNPWNPGTRYVMSRIPFDRDAITLAPPEAARLLRAGGFEVLRTDFLFIFPRFLSWFRPLERALVGFPLGAQYLVLARKPL